VRRLDQRRDQCSQAQVTQPLLPPFQGSQQRAEKISSANANSAGTRWCDGGRPAYGTARQSSVFGRIFAREPVQDFYSAREQERRERILEQPVSGCGTCFDPWLGKA
jgi:hypothetical protein